MHWNYPCKRRSNLHCLGKLFGSVWRWNTVLYCLDVFSHLRRYMSGGSTGSGMHWNYPCEWYMDIFDLEYVYSNLRRWNTKKNSHVFRCCLWWYLPGYTDNRSGM